MSWCASCTSCLVEVIDDETVYCGECRGYRGRLT